jgi:hypothetical protein
MTFEELSVRAEREGGLLLECFRLLEKHGLRTFFDPLDPGRRQIGTPELVRVLKAFEGCGVRFLHLLEMFQQSYRPREYILEDLPLLIIDYRKSDYTPELPYDLQMTMSTVDAKFP